MLRKVIGFVLASLTAVTTIIATPNSVDAIGSSLQERVAERRAARAEKSSQSTPPLRTLRQNRSTAASQQKRIRTSRRNIRKDVRQRRQAEEESRIMRINERKNMRIQNLSTKRTFKEQVIFATNVERHAAGLPPFTQNTLLEISAQKHAEDMLHRAYFDHENPDGQRSGDRIKAAGYGEFDTSSPCRCLFKLYMGENIARGQKSVEQVVAEWMASPPHRAAILSQDYREIGIGIIEDVWVQNFGAMIVEELE